MPVRFFSIVRRALQLLALGGWLPAVAGAHGAFDHSTRVWVFADHLEVGIAMGPEAAKTFLNDGPPEVTRSGLMQIAYAYPAGNAARLFEIKSGNTALAPTKATVRSDGLEFDFELIYPRPAGGTLRLRAAYLNELHQAGKGSLAVADESGATLAARLLASGDDTLEITLPGSVSAPIGGVSQPAPTTATTAPVAAPVKSAPLQTLASSPSFGEFFKLGVTHILSGFDHLLFLGALLIGVRKVGPMLVVITCFTMAHSITLALAATGVVVIPSRITEPLIAVSIIVVAVGNLFRPAATSDRHWLAAGFGLIHGFGFASALREAGLGSKGLALAKPLFAFNLGVEAGQLLVAALFLPLLFRLLQAKSFERYGIPAISTLILALGSFWLVQRLLF